MTGPLPHEDYIHAVYDAFHPLGIEAVDAITTTPDGRRLDGVISFSREAFDSETWPGGVHLGWDQHSGWSLCDEGARSLYDLDIVAYANPRGVAERAATRLAGEPDGWVDEAWDGAESLGSAISAWEADR